MLDRRKAVLGAVLAMLLAGPAAAMSYKDIGGRWCSEKLEYDFTRDQLTVRFDDGTPTRNFEITSYEYTDTEVIMYWINRGKKVRTVFAEFNDRFMAQQKNDAGPRRPFHRCR